MKTFKQYVSPVVIVAGIHGDEPAGNIAAQYFTNHKGVKVIKDINLSGKRRFEGKDLNRQFGRSTCKIADQILNNIIELNPKLVICLHEDNDALATR